MLHCITEGCIGGSRKGLVLHWQIQAGAKGYIGGAGCFYVRFLELGELGNTQECECLCMRFGPCS